MQSLSRESRETLGDLSHGSLMLSVTKNSKSLLSHIKNGYFPPPSDII